MCRKQHVNATTFAIYIQILVGRKKKKNPAPFRPCVCDQNRSQNSSSDDDDDDDDDGAGETVARDGH